MRRKIISVVLVVVLLLFCASCKKDENENLLKQTIVASSAVSGNVEAARDYGESISGEHIEFSSDSDAVVAVLNGKADYVVLDEYSGYLFENENDRLCFVEKCDYNIEYRACFSLDNSALCDEFNEAFATLKKDGTVDKIKSAVYNNEEYVTSKSTGDKGVIVMACDPIFDNRVYIDDNGKNTGVDVYIAKEVCSYLGYTLVIETMDFENMFLALDEGKADFVMSCVERTDQRAEHYLFSDVYTTYDYNVYKLK